MRFRQNSAQRYGKWRNEAIALIEGCRVLRPKGSTGGHDARQHMISCESRLKPGTRGRNKGGREGPDVSRVATSSR
jgi:hypothetical protein